MKKLITLLLVLTGMVSTASAANSASIKYWVSGEKTVSCIKITDNNFRVLITPAMFNSSGFYFRFIVDETEYGLYKNATSDYLLSTSGDYAASSGSDMSNSYSFKIASTENSDDDIVIVNINYWESKWRVSYYKRAATTNKVSFVNTGSWSAADVYTWDSDGVPLTGNWPGTPMTDNHDGTYSYTVKVPTGGNNKVQFNDGTNSNQTGNLSLSNNQVYNASGIVAAQTIPFTDTYGTFSSVYPLNFPGDDADVMAYKATVSGNKVILSHVTGVVPANTGLFVKKISDAATVTVSPAATPTADMSGNLLVAGTTSGVPATAGSTYNYVFGKKDQDYGFFNANVAININMTGKAYLSSTTALTAPNASRIALVFDDETTGIEAIDVTPETVKEGAREYYNLNGQRVMNPSKGLYIVNGKKVIIK